MQGCNDGLEGDVVMLMPAFNVTERDIEKIVEAFAAAVETLLGPDGSLVANELSG
jgi:adenosylmethionine-8-amino-7-oxononanoate aminotransferase